MAGWSDARACSCEWRAERLNPEGRFVGVCPMNRPPQYPHFVSPGEPRWRRWWVGLGLLMAGQSAAVAVLWPKEQPRLDMLLWSAVLPLCWALGAAVRRLVWHITLFNRNVYLRTVEAAEYAWWQRRSIGLPVQDVLLLGPAGEEQASYLNAMIEQPLPLTLYRPGNEQPMLRCPLWFDSVRDRERALADRMGQLALGLPGLVEESGRLRALAWVGPLRGQAAFLKSLSTGGVTVPEPRLPLQDLGDLDDVIDIFHRDCPDSGDWLLCAGVVSRTQAQPGGLPGEAGFVWRVSHRGAQLLHRGEYQASESATDLCLQVQRYAGLALPPSICVAVDKESHQAIATGGWAATAHQVAGYWGELGQLAPFVGMSLALLQAGHSAQPCGWLSQEETGRLAVGVAVPHDS